MEEQDLRPPEKEARRLEGKVPDLEEVLASPSIPLGDGLGSFFKQGPDCTDERAKLFRELWELMSIQCSTWNVFREKLSLMYGDFTCQNVFQLGMCFMQLLLSMPREASNNEHRHATPSRRQRDLLPLPLPPVGAAVKVLKLFTRNPKGFVIFDENQLKGTHKQQRKKLLSRACSQIWRFNCTTVLNGQYLDWRGPLYFDGFELNPSQQEARNNIERCCNYFTQEPCKSFGPVDFQMLVKMKGVDYTGEEISHALPLRLGELLPGLPDGNVAGSLDAAATADEEVRQWLENPEQCLLPRELWPVTLPRASMNVKKEDWPKIAQTLVERNILVPIEYEDIFQAGGAPVLNGMFCVLKKGTPAAGEVRITRLIMNLTPANSIQRLMRGDLDTLAAASHWAGCQLPPGAALLWSGDDQKGAFYAWALPEAWRKFMAFRWPVPGWCLGMPEKKEVWLASKVIPMGWINSVSLFQHLHRRIGLQPQPHGAGLEREEEMRRDRPVPKSAATTPSGWISFYLDDFDCPEIVPASMAAELAGTLSERHSRQRDAYQKAGVCVSEEKAHLREVKVERMGAEIDGIGGWLGVPLQKKLEVGYFVLWALQEERCRQKVLMMILGRLTRCFEFRRPLMSILNRSWPKSKHLVSRPLSQRAILELIRSICVLPMAVANLFTPVSGLVSCSDASEKGGGLCVSAGLSEKGLGVLKAMDDERNVREATCFQPAGSCDVRSGSKGPRVLVISLFDGVGAMMVALSRLDCVVVGYASCEIDRRCKRLTRTRWPGIIELGDIRKVSDKTMELLSASVGYKLDLVIIGAGSPCQDLSGLNATGKGLAGEKSRLFYEVPRVINLARRHFRVPVEAFVENVASMTNENVKGFTKALQVDPVLLDAKHFCHCRRPRFYWPTWSIEPQGDEILEMKDLWMEWKFPTVRGTPSEWLEENCDWKPKGEPVLPTFTRPQRRTTPPFKPAGLDSATAGAVQRWEEDRYYVQVYNYEESNMIVRSDGTLRLPTVAEKEVIMGFDAGYISKSFSEKEKPSEKDLVGGQMIGNTFNVYSVMMLLHELLRQHGGQAQRDPRQLVSIKGNSPDAWAKYPQFVSGGYECKKVEALVKHILRYGERGGTDVRLDINIPFRMKAWPRAGLRSHWFNWAIVHGYTWKSCAHINGLELQAVLNALKWRLRKASRGGHRILHLVDSQVVASILAKGRTSSFRLQLGVSKYSALVVASGTVVAVAYVDTRDNPADIPSRWAEDKQKLNRKKGSKDAQSTL